jgi:hypothetical protein
VHEDGDGHRRSQELMVAEVGRQIERDQAP